MDANGLEQNVVLSQLKQCRSHMLTQRKRRQKNRLICIQLRLLRTRFEIKDTWIENDFDLFLGGGVGGEEVRWKTVRTYGKILATPLIVKQVFLNFLAQSIHAYQGRVFQSRIKLFHDKREFGLSFLALH